MIDFGLPSNHDRLAAWPILGSHFDECSLDSLSLSPPVSSYHAEAVNVLVEVLGFSLRVNGFDVG